MEESVSILSAEPFPAPEPPAIGKEGLLRRTSMTLLNSFCYLFVTIMATAIFGLLILSAMGKGVTQRGDSSVVSSLLCGLFAMPIAVWFLRLEDQPAASLGLSVHLTGLRRWTTGLALGLASVILLVGFLLAAGFAEWRTLPPTWSHLSATVAWLGFFAMQSMGEEIVQRGYLQVQWTRRVSAAAGILVPSVIFSVFHLPNAGITKLGFFNTFLSAVILALLRHRLDDLWLVGGLHAGWNFALALFSLNVSGNPIRFSHLTVDLRANDWWTGGRYGLEASVECTVLLFAALWLTQSCITKSLIRSESKH